MARQRRAEGSRKTALTAGLLLLAAVAALAVWLAPDRDPGDEEQSASRSQGTAAEPASNRSAQRLVARVVKVFPHDPTAWTQGLLWHEGWLYESTGLHGESTLRRVRLEDGSVDLRVPVEDQYFAEGLARVGRRLYQLTWRSGVGLRYELDEFTPLEPFGYAGPGWGLCFDGRSLVRSDGSSTLFFHDPDTFEVRHTVSVHLGGQSISGLNELECAEGWVYANVLSSEAILRIDPANGRIDAVIDATGLLSEEEGAEANVLNGIAYYPPNRSFLLTGKYWPKLFEVVFVAQ